MEFVGVKFSMRRPLSDYTRVQRLVGAVIRNRRFFAYLKQEGCYVDIGCGTNIDRSFCNLDYRWRPGVDVCWDVAKGLPFPDAYADGIFSEHLIEHIPFEAALNLLKECRRVLRAGRVLRIMMPDAELYLKEYAARGETAKLPYADRDAARFPFVTPMVSVNRIFRWHNHRFLWDFQTLREGLHRAGFETVDLCQFRQGEDARLLRDRPERAIESFYVEAR